MLLPEEKHAVAVHEAGHALVAALSEHADPVAKVTILPAGQALGVTQQLPLVERHLYGEDYLHDSLAVRLGGRAAELVELGQGSTGAANDLAGRHRPGHQDGARVRAVARARPGRLPARAARCSWAAAGTGCPAGRSPRPPRPPSTGEVARLLREAEQNAVGLIRAHRAELDQLVSLLLEHETVDGSEVYRIVGRPVPERRPRR